MPVVHRSRFVIWKPVPSRRMAWTSRAYHQCRSKAMAARFWRIAIPVYMWHPEENTHACSILLHRLSTRCGPAAVDLRYHTTCHSFRALPQVGPQGSSTTGRNRDPGTLSNPAKKLPERSLTMSPGTCVRNQLRPKPLELFSEATLLPSLHGVCSTRLQGTCRMQDKSPEHSTSQQ